MQGYIIHINKVKDEDLLVTLLTKNNIKTLYRFYGARHSVINLGYKVDFESVPSLKSSLSQMRSILHLGAPWNADMSRMFVWQPFIRLFYLHLKDIETIDTFYFHLLDECAAIWHKQNPKRIAIEAYIKILEYEGRLHDDFICFNCEEHINEELTLIRGFLPAHTTCAWNNALSYQAIEKLFTCKSSVALDDHEVEMLWKVVQEGF